MEKKKTAVKKNTLNPEFNEQFEFFIPMEKLKDYTLEVTVMDKDRIGRNECIGKVKCRIKKNYHIFLGDFGTQRKRSWEAALEGHDFQVGLILVIKFTNLMSFK